MPPSSSGPRRDAGHHAPAWRIHGGRAEAVVRPGVPAGPAGPVAIDLAAPAGGLATAGGDRLLGIDIGVEHEPRDAWVRGDDLVATWESGDERDLVTTALWRRDGAPGLVVDAGIDAFVIVASATTRLLQADSTLAVTSSLAADAVLSARWDGAKPGRPTEKIDPRDGIHLVRRGDGTSVLIAIHPADHQASTIVRAGDRVRIACWLFAAGVEKGVLLRSRVLAAVGPAEGDLEWTRALSARFADLPPELST